MSKNKGKEKKGSDSSSGLEAVVESQKREILEQSFTIKKLQDRISRMTEENYQIVHNQDQMQSKYEQKIENQRIYIENHENTIESLNKKVQGMKLTKVELESAVKTLQQRLESSEQAREREMEEYKKLIASEMRILKSQLKEYDTYMNERDTVYSENSNLRTQLENEKQSKQRELADKEREKVKATDQLKDEMLNQIREMKSKLLSLKKDQLSTTTRLAVLKNHQLTGELQFQSKQTEKLLFNNEKLQKKAAGLERDLEIHKELEEELAKRSQLSKGIIKKLTSKIAELEEEINSRSNGDTERETAQPAKQSETLVSVLNQALEEKDNSLFKLKTELSTIQNENNLLKTKLRDINKSCNELTVLLVKYYEDILQGKIELRPQGEYVLDIKGISSKPVEQWDSQDAKLVVSILLDKIKSSISRYNLGVQVNRKQAGLPSDIEQETKLPSIAEHSLLRKDDRKFKEIPSSLAPKIVGSNLRQWGRIVHSQSVSSISKKRS